MVSWSKSSDREMLTILAEYMKTHSGRMKVVGVAGIISRLVPGHPGDA